MTRSFAAFALAAACLPVSAQTSVDIQPGMWEYQIQVKMAGMPQNNMPPTTIRRCITAQDVAQNKHLSGDQGKNPCTISNMRASAGKASFDMSCKMDEVTMKGSSTVTATPTAMEVESQMQFVPPPAPGMGQMTQKMRAKRVGNC